ncbi:MAG TPA: hypothetical protein VHD61_01775 [Lacunisphaera sp.]|nr:hypothetical protein [Lacunisphaera sp.]
MSNPLAMFQAAEVSFRRGPRPPRRRPLRRRFLAGLMFLLPVLARAQGGPPLATDDPGTPGDGNWEINLAWTREHAAGATAQESPLVDINYGWGERLQLKYEASWLVLSGEGRGARAGVSDSSAGVKWRFRDDGPQGWAVSTFPQLGFRTAGSSVRRGVATGDTTFLLPFEVQRTFGVLELNADAGWSFDRRAPDGWLGGLAAGTEWRPGCELLAEIHAEGETGAGLVRLLGDVGARVRLGAHATLLVSAGGDLRRRDGGRAVISYVGVQLTR